MLFILKKDRYFLVSMNDISETPITSVSDYMLNVIEMIIRHLNNVLEASTRVIEMMIRTSRLIMQSTATLENIIDGMKTDKSCTKERAVFIAFQIYR